jgi:hypothetical protein
MLEVGILFVVVLHFAVTLVPALGVFAVVRWPRLIWVHVPIVLWAFSVPFAQWPCPLTDLEKSLRENAGMPVYSGHFVRQYFWLPLGDHGEAIFNWANVLCIATGYVWVFFSHAPLRRKRAA